jgi:hypothetical protein
LTGVVSILILKACFSAGRSMRYDRAAEAKSLADEQLEVLPACPIIVDCRAQAVTALHGRVGYCGEALLLHSQHDLRRP